MQALKRRTLFSKHHQNDGDHHAAPPRPWDTLHNLHHLKRSLAWSQPPPARQTSSSVEGLNERLEELLVLELHQNGSRQYFAWSVRTLYKHVLKCITQTSSAQDEGNDAPVARSMSPQKSVMRVASDSSNIEPSINLGDALVTPVPLGLLPPAAKPKKLPQRRRAASTNENPRVSSGTERTSNPTYRERLGGYLHPRDMRRLVTPFSASNEPELIVRRHVMLLNFDPLRAIVLRDRLLVIVPDGADSVLVQLETRLHGGGDAMHSSFWNDAESDNENNAISHGNPPSMDPVSVSGHGNNKSNLLNKYMPSGGMTEDTGAPTATTLSGSLHSKDSDLLDTNSDDHDIHPTLEASEWMDIKDNKWVDLPFELQCVDAVLNVISNLLASDTFELQEASMNYIHRLLHPKNSYSDDPLTIIRAVKDAVREMSSRVKGFVQSLDRVLDEDEDMALMNLSRLITHPERFLYPVSQEVLDEESDEPELILESYLQTALSLTNSLHLIQGQIDSAAELVNQKQDSVRNRLLFANMVISVFTLCITCAALVGSFVGMNVPNHMEENGTAFRDIVTGTMAGTSLMGCLIFFLLVRTQTIPSLATLFSE
jgi:magnesium transporter